jgi:16S rRNA (cytidine1402-2'-O)-methyltransferase
MDNLQKNLKNQSGILYIVATPIGNLADITYRAVDTLKNVDAILCEDTRTSSKLLASYAIKTKTYAYTDYSDHKIHEKILQRLQQGDNLAIISDAGTPLISDPGYKLVHYLLQHQMKIVPIPGASAVISALCASGHATDKFYFHGFLHHGKEHRRNEFEELKAMKLTLVFYESPNRLLDTLQIMLEVFGNRKVAVARELTKLYEEFIRGDLQDVIKQLVQRDIKGECVVLLEGAVLKEVSDSELKEKLKVLFKDYRLKEAVQILAEVEGVGKNHIYELALAVKRESE